jgi:hypothetical protein
LGKASFAKTDLSPLVFVRIHALGVAPFSVEARQGFIR